MWPDSVTLLLKLDDGRPHDDRARFLALIDHTIGGDLHFRHDDLDRDEPSSGRIPIQLTGSKPLVATLLCTA